MLCEKFSESWFNREHVVARRRLRPFCLWHHAYLDHVNSPLSPGAEIKKDAPPITWAEIEEAARICQLQYEESLPEKVDLRAKIGLFVAMAKSTEEKELKAFHDYVNDYFAPPTFNKFGKKTVFGRPGSGPRGGPPDPLSVASAVIMMFGGGIATEKLVWEMPIGKAYWYSSTLHYNRGAPLDYVTAREERIRRFLREQRRKGLI
jgi:hypothetical protein